MMERSKPNHAPCSSAIGDEKKIKDCDGWESNGLANAKPDNTAMHVQYNAIRCTDVSVKTTRVNAEIQSTEATAKNQ